MSTGKQGKHRARELEVSGKDSSAMRRLTLVRHAKSDMGLSGQQDWDRVLNRRGQQDALKPDLILSSPAVRALSTASIMARELKVPADRIAQDERLYLADPKRILEVVHELGGDAGHVMVFGHNPGITDCANRLSAGDRIDTLPTCGVFTACFAVDDWSQLSWESGCEAVFDYPRNLA
jgi:phosphohistidine phosphatase